MTKSALTAPQNAADAEPATGASETPKRAERPAMPETANLQLDVIRRTRKLTGRL